MSFVVAGSAAVGIGSSLISSGAASDAAAGQLQATRETNKLQKKMYDQTRADQEPWRAAGARSLADLASDDFKKDFSMGDYQMDPGYNFRMEEGQKAIERSAAARGGLNSGATLKALTKFGQGVASEEYANAYNRFNADRDRRFNRASSIAGVGQTANSALQTAGSNYANQVGANTMGAADARGAAGIASANQIGSTLGGLANNWMDYSLSKRK